MRRYRPAFRLVSLAAAAAMVIPIIAPAAHAAVVSIFSPQPGETVPGRNVEVAVGYNTQSDARVTRVELWIDGQMHSARNLLQPLSRGVASFWWDAGKASSGSHEIVVKVFCGEKLVGSSRSHATIGRNVYDLHPPTVKLANIKSGQVLKGKMPIIIESVDDGDEAPIVSLLVDNGLKMLSNNRPLVYELDTSQYTNGKHEIKVLAYDSSGNKSEPLICTVAFENDVNLPVAVSPAPAAPPEGTPASEDDYAPAIPTESASNRQDGQAARSATDPVTGALAPTVARPLSPSKTHAPDVVKKTSAARPERSKAPLVAVSKRPVEQPKPVARIEARQPVATAPKPPAIKNVEARIGGVKEQVAHPVVSKKAAAAAASSSSLSERTTQVKSSGAPPESDAAKPESVSAEPVLVARAAAPTPPTFEPAVKPVTEGPMIPMPDVKPDESIPQTQPASELKRDTLVAMAMTRQKQTQQPTVAGSIQIRRDTKAKLEKRVVPVSGKVKIRDIFDGIGGVLFWDPATRTVTGYVSGMKMELRIGSRLMKVNGKTAKISKAPYIVAGRTIIDAGVYHQAREMANEGSQVAAR